MIAKFEIEYVIHPQHNHRVDTHRTDDPVEAGQADRMLRVAAERLASRLLGRSLDLDSVQVKHRFGFAA